jgi:eukaryotic-like serine/threonine-protein kinase
MPANRCPSCGAPLPAHALGGRCPRCLLSEGLVSEATGVDRGSIGATLDLPATARSVLETIGATIGGAPRILLRDTAFGEEPSPITMPTHGNEASTRYRIDGEIARGGMGTILKGRDPDLGRDVAIKVLREDRRHSAELVRRFVEEAQIGGQLQHPGLVPIYELGTFADQRPYFSMKLVKGETLADLLAARKTPSDDLPRFLSIFASIAQTMAYAHTRGVIHRDLKPSNVMVGSFGEVQVMDWGLAKVLPRGGVVADAKAGGVVADAKGRKEPSDDTLIATARSGSDTDLSHAGSVLGTPSYMAPEQARGETDLLNERADVFALGSILCETLTGSPAFTGHNSTEILRKAARGDTADALARLDGCGAESELIALARDCLALEPEDRPRDANVVSERTTAYLAGVQERVQAAERERVVAVARAIEERRRRRLQLALAASVLAFTTLGGLSTTYYLQQRGDRARQRTELAAATDRVVGRAATLRDQAEANPEDLARWQVALAAVQEAEAAGHADAAPRLLALRSEIQAGLEAARRDRALLDRLIDIRSAAADDVDGSATEAAYANAFREAGIDLANLSPAEAGSKLKARRASVVLGLAVALDDWASIRRGRRGNPGGAARLSEVASVGDADIWRKELRVALDLSDKAALQALAQTAKYDELGPISLQLLGTGLEDAGDLKGAESVLRRAQQRHPRDVWVNYELGKVLDKLKRPDEAIRFYTAARSVRPETAHELAHALEKRGDSDEAIAVFRDLIELRPDISRHLGCFSQLLAKQGKLDEIIAELRARKRLDPSAKIVMLHAGTGLYYAVSLDEAITGYPGVVAHHRFRLACALKDRGNLDGAVADYREAIRLEPNHAPAYSGLVLALKAQGKLDEAVADYREAIRLKPGSALAHFHLGGVLRAIGDYAGSLAMFRRGHELGNNHPDWPYPSQDWVANAERQANVAQRLTVVLQGKDRPKNNAERLTLASMCAETNRFAAAVWLTAEALESDPKLADDLRVLHRHRAADRAALAGVGQGVDDPRPDEAARNRFRTQARAWIRADLGLCSKKLDAGNEQDYLVIVQAIQHWKDCPYLAGIRDAPLLTKLPPDEQKECQALWAEATELESRADELLKRFLAESARVPVPGLKTVTPTSKTESTASPSRETLTIGDEAPAISVSTWVKGDPVDRLDPKRIYVVEFWATWCGPCRVSIPHLTELQKKYRQKGVTVIGVSVDQNRNAVAPYVKEMGDKMDYTVALDDVPEGEDGGKGKMAESWMEAADHHEIPTAFIVRDGKVAWIGHPMAMDEALEKSSAKEFNIEVAARPYRAQVAYDHKRFAAAARLWAEALATDPKLADGRHSQHRYNAARAAALAAAGQGQDQPPLDDATKAKLRGHALDWLKVELRVTANCAGKARIIAAAAPLPDLLEQLAESAPNDGQFQAELARHFAEQANTPLTTAARAKARALFEQQLAKEPQNATVAADLAQLLRDLPEQGIAPRWTVLKPTEMKSESGASLTLQPDGSVLASGVNPDNDVYVIEVAVPGPVGAIRLEVIPDPSMPAGGSGRAPIWGNFVLTDFRVKAGEKAVTWSSSDADFSQSRRNGQIRRFPIAFAIDADESTGWAIWPQVSQPHWAVFLPSQPITTAGQTRLTFRLAFRSKDMLKYALGRFRLSVSDDPAAFEREQERFALLKVTDPWVMLAAGYALNGRNDKASEYFGKALLANPSLGDDRQSQYRYNAARAAASAAAGRGQDQPPLDDVAKSKLRHQALDWLKAELSAWRHISMIIEPGNKQVVARSLAHWKQDRGLSGIRDEKELAKLPEAERKEWQSLWADVEALLKRAEGQTPTTP